MKQAKVKTVKGEPILFKDINPGADSSYPSNLTEINGTLYFTADDGTNGKELWKSDGTSEGTVLVKDINPGSDSSEIEDLIEIDGTLYFTADNGTNGKELWSLSLTPSPTIAFKTAILTEEEGSNAVITLTRSGEDLSEASQVTISMTGGTATAGEDFDDSSFSQTITFAAGETETSFTIPLLDDASLEATKTIYLSLTAEDNAVIDPNNSQASIYITDNDEVPPAPLKLTGNTSQIAFVAYYGRPADRGGHDFWNGVLADNAVSYASREGDSLTGSKGDVYNQIVDAFGNSEEAERLFGQFSSDRDKVNRVYQFAFDRDGEDEGLDYWTDQIDLGNVTLATFALEVALGAQNQDIIVLNNKIESADLFTNSIDIQTEIDAYQGSEGEIFGRNWLSQFGSTVSLQTQIDSTLNELVS